VPEKYWAILAEKLLLSLRTDVCHDVASSVLYDCLLAQVYGSELAYEDSSSHCMLNGLFWMCLLSLRKCFITSDFIKE
jgi:hypothetical protein